MSNPRPFEAGRVHVQNPYQIYARENRQRVHAAILESNPELRRRIERGENGDTDDDYYEADDELYALGTTIMKKDFQKVPESEKERFQKEAIESRNNQWRSIRKQGRLVENDESLAQRAEDEKKGITGPIHFGQASSGSSAHQVTGTFIGGQMLTPLQELTPPFDRNTLKMKTGKLEAEEYF